MCCCLLLRRPLPWRTTRAFLEPSAPLSVLRSFSNEQMKESIERWTRVFRGSPSGIAPSCRPVEFWPMHLRSCAVSNRVTVPLSPATNNVVILCSAPGHKVFSSFVAPHEASSPLHLCCPVISDNKADACNSDHDDNDNDTLSPTVSLEGEEEEEEINTDSPHPSPSVPSPDEQRPTVVPFDLDHNDP